MREIVLQAILILIVGTLLIAALLTPAVYSLLLVIFPQFPWPFSRVYDRVAMLALLLLVILLRRSFNLQTLARWLRQGNIREKCRLILAGACCSLIPVLFLVPYLVYRGELGWSAAGAGAIAAKLPKFILAALVISLLEEVFFRALLFIRLQEKTTVFAAAVLSSLLYALAHFISPVKSYVYPGWSWSAGFSYLGAVFGRFFHPQTLPAFFGLFLIGLTLCYALRAFGRWYLCVGLHTGWVIAAKLTALCTQIPPGALGPGMNAERHFLVGRLYGWCAVLLTFFVLAVLRKKQSCGQKDPVCRSAS